MSKNKILFAVIGLVIFGVGFFAGMEYKAYQVRRVLSELTSQLSNALATDPDADAKEKQKTFADEVKENKEVVIDKNLNDLVQLATINVRVLFSEEKTIINVPYGTPEVADKGAKFVVLTVDITNTTSAPFTFDGDFPLLDQKGRQFAPDNLSSIADNLEYADLSPSIVKSGKIVYQVPEDSISYSLITRKAGTNEVYKILVK